jgi:hypothetical protein
MSDSRDQGDQGPPRVDKRATARTAALTGLAAHKPLIPISQQVA